MHGKFHSMGAAADHFGTSMQVVHPYYCKLVESGDAGAHSSLQAAKAAWDVGGKLGEEAEEVKPVQTKRGGKSKSLKSLLEDYLGKGVSYFSYTETFQWAVLQWSSGVCCYLAAAKGTGINMDGGFIMMLCASMRPRAMALNN